MSGVYFYGSGMRTAVTCVHARRVTPAPAAARAGCNDGTFLPRNSFVGSPLHRIDTRLQKRFPLGGRRSIDGIVELFNLFNHKNYGSYTTAVDNAAFGQPVYNNNVAYASRAAQLGFRTRVLIVRMSRFGSVSFGVAARSRHLFSFWLRSQLAIRS